MKRKLCIAGILVAFLVQITGCANEKDKKIFSQKYISANDSSSCLVSNAVSPVQSNSITNSLVSAISQQSKTSNTISKQTKASETSNTTAKQSQTNTSKNSSTSSGSTSRMPPNPTIPVTPKIDVYGNLAMNIYQGGFACFSNNFVYYTGIRQFNNNGTGKKEINSVTNCATNMNVVGDWIYYINDNENICKIKTDGTCLTKLTDYRCCNLIVVNDWIYFIDRWRNIL